MQFGHKHAHEHITGVRTYTGRAYENPTPLGGRKLCSLVISMLLSILQDVGSYMERAYENPNMGYLISTLIDARKLCSLVISMLMSILQDVGRDAGTGGGQEGQLPLLPFARRGKGAEVPFEL